MCFIRSNSVMFVVERSRINSFTGAVLPSFGLCEGVFGFIGV